MSPRRVKPRPRGEEKLDPTRLMLAYLCVATEGREASLVRKVGILLRFGLTNQEIAKVCGVGGQAVADAKLTAKRVKR